MLFLSRHYLDLTADGHNTNGDDSLIAAQHIYSVFWVFCLVVVLHRASFNRNCGLRRLQEERLNILDQKAVFIACV